MSQNPPSIEIRLSVIHDELFKIAKEIEETTSPNASDFTSKLKAIGRIQSAAEIVGEAKLAVWVPGLIARAKAKKKREE